MSVDSGGTDEFLSGLKELSQALRDVDRSIYDLQFHALAFGSWTVQAGSRHKRLRITWDGKEAILSIDSSSFPSSTAIPYWRPLADSTIALHNGHLDADRVRQLAQLVALHT